MRSPRRRWNPDRDFAKLDETQDGNRAFVLFVEAMVTMAIFVVVGIVIFRACGEMKSATREAQVELERTHREIDRAIDEAKRNLEAMGANRR